MLARTPRRIPSHRWQSSKNLEQLVDELNLSPNIRTAHPPRLPLPDHVHCLVSLDRSARRVELATPLLGLHPSFDRSMVLLQDIVQVLDRPMSAAAAQGSFLFHCWNRRAVEACLIGIDDAGMRMRWIAESLAKQPFGRRGIAQPREREVDRGPGGIDGSVEVAPATQHRSPYCCTIKSSYMGRLPHNPPPYRGDFARWSTSLDEYPIAVGGKAAGFVVKSSFRPGWTTALTSWEQGCGQAFLGDSLRSPRPSDLLACQLASRREDHGQVSIIMSVLIDVS